MTSTVLYFISMAIMLGMVSAYCSFNLERESILGEEKVAIDCFKQSDGKKTWNDAMETCRHYGGTLANDNSVVQLMNEYMNDGGVPIDYLGVWVSDNRADNMISETSTCTFLNYGHHGEDSCSAKKNYVCSIIVDRWNWCSSLDNNNMPDNKVLKLCNYFGGRMEWLSSSEHDRCTYSVLPSNYPTWINHNKDGYCYLRGNANGIPDGQCITPPENTYVYVDYGSLVLNFHRNPADWETAKRTCHQEGGTLIETDEKMTVFRDILFSQGKAYTEWWVGGECVLVKDTVLVEGNCGEQKKFVCEKQK